MSGFWKLPPYWPGISKLSLWLEAWNLLRKGLKLARVSCPRSLLGIWLRTALSLSPEKKEDEILGEA